MRAPSSASVVALQARNLFVLVTCQLITSTATFTFVTLGGLIGATLTDNKAFVTLPLSLMIVAGATATVPASVLMQRIGRRRGFAVGSLIAAAGATVAVLALYNEDFAMFCAGAMLVGVNVAFTQQYRFAAAESVATQFVPRAISFVLLGAIGGAFIGREIATRGDAIDAATPFAGSISALAVMFVGQSLLFALLREPQMHEESNQPQSDRPLAEIVLRPVYLTAVFGGIVAYGVMTLIMTATPLSMHINDGFSIDETSRVVRAHVLAMYVPSLFSGFLIERLGVTRLMAAGAVILFATMIVGLQGHSLMHYWWALVLLGVGWNFLFVGGTTLLTYTYSAAERYRAQAVNEFLVFGMSASSSLLAGTVMFHFGWTTLMLVPLPVLAGIVLALVLIRKDPLLTHQQRVSN